MQPDPQIYIPRPRQVSRYLPHQSVRECRRRLRQIAEGRLKGSETFIPMGTRLAAVGLVGFAEAPPNNKPLVSLT